MYKIYQDGRRILTRSLAFSNLKIECEHIYGIELLGVIFSHHINSGFGTEQATYGFHRMIINELFGTFK